MKIEKLETRKKDISFIANLVITGEKSLIYINS